MKVPTDFGDPLAETVLAARAELELSQSSETPPDYLEGLVIASVLPGDKAPNGPLLVIVQGPWTAYTAGVSAECRLRTVAYDLDPDVAYDVVRWLQRRLLARRGNAAVNSWRYDEGPQRSTDPDNRTPIGTAAIRARMRPRIS